MKIVAADIYDTNLHEYKPPIILRLITDEGQYGLAEFPLAYGAGRQAAIGMLQDLVEGHVLGSDPMRIEEMWQRLFRRTFWGQGGGPIVYGGISAVDVALWDIKGKVFGCPIYELLGGKVHDRLRGYANGWYSGEWAPGDGWRPIWPQEYGELAREVIALGYDALKFDPFGAPPNSNWGFHSRDLAPERADLAYERVAAVREAVGPEVDVLVEVHGWLGTRSAIQWGQRIEELDPYVYEEPLDAMNVACMRKVSERVNIPLAAGERLYTRYQFREYIEQQVIDLLQPDIGLAGGITEVKKIAAMAETYDLHVQPHNCHGPIATAAAVQLDACCTNFLIQELVPFRDRITYEIVNEPPELEIEDGHLVVPDRPGLGVTLNEEMASRCPRIRLGKEGALL